MFSHQFRGWLVGTCAKCMRALGIALLYGPRGRRFLMGEVPLWWVGARGV